jgi:SH3-like domain-containing protein
MRALAVFFLAAMVATSVAAVAPPHFVSQRADLAYLREGPGYDHKILWVYRHRGYPFVVTASFDVWRRVVAVDGTTGWMSANMLSDQRTVLVTGKGRAQIRESATGGKVVGLADPGAVAGLKTCTADACHIRGAEIDGWIPRNRIWGISDGETFK